MFDPSQKMSIDVDQKGSGFIVKCPMWANDLLDGIPSKRWSKSDRGWKLAVIRQNVAALKPLIALAGVITSDAALKMVFDHEAKIAKMHDDSGFPPWYKFKTEPRKHQARALNRGYGLKAFALFMDMQTGKSKTTIDLLSCHRMEGHIFGALILVKLTLRRNWVKQFQLHCPLETSIHLPQTTDQKGFDQWLSKPHDFKIMIAGWESLSVGGMAGMCERFLLSMSSSAIAGDETTYIANHKAARSEASVRLARMSEYRYALTGTPATEGPMNLYQQFEFLDPDVIGIGDFYAFRNRYAVMGGYRPKEGKMKDKPMQIVGYQNLDELMDLIAPHTFQVTKNEAYDLPPKRYEIREVQLTKVQRDLCVKIKKEGVLGNTNGEDEHVLQNTLEIALRLHQITGGFSVSPREERRVKKSGEEVVKMVFDPVRLLEPDKNPKLIELMEVVEEYKGKKGIIWAVYSPEIADIAHLMKAAGYRIGELHGKIPENDRQPMVDAFERGELDWMVGNASTGGMGYTMMRAEVSIFYSNTFKMIDRLQAEDRAYGDGQTKSGVWIDIVAEKSVDILIMKALEAKQDVSEYIKHRIREVTKLLDGED